MKKAVFFDIDGTLWDRERRIPQSTQTALSKLHENGIYTFICSGRAPSYIKDPSLLALGFDGILAGLGTCVTLGDQELVCETIAPKQLQQTLEVLKKYRMPVVLEGKTYHYITAADFAGDPFLEVLKSELGEQLLELGEHELQWEANKFSAVIDQANYQKALEELSPWYDFLVHDNAVVEGVPKGFSKASGIQVVCEKLEIAHEDTYAFGDSVNDLEMLTYVGHGIAMGNGTPKAKQAADYVTDAIHKDGIYNACKYFRLI